MPPVAVAAAQQQLQVVLPQLVASVEPEVRMVQMLGPILAVAALARVSEVAAEAVRASLLCGTSCHSRLRPKHRRALV